MSAAEVEDVLYGLEPVAQAAVLPREDQELGEVPVAFVTLMPGIGADQFKEQLHDLLAGRISGFKKPREVIVLDEMPQTGSGKVHKPTLRGRLQSPVSQHDESR